MKSRNAKRKGRSARIGRFLDWWIDGGYRREPCRKGCASPGRCAVAGACVCAWAPLVRGDQGRVHSQRPRSGRFEVFFCL